MFPEEDTWNRVARFIGVVLKAKKVHLNGPHILDYMTNVSWVDDYSPILGSVSNG